MIVTIPSEVGSSKLYVSFAQEPYKRDYVLQKRPMILWSLRIDGEATILTLD